MAVNKRNQKLTEAEVIVIRQLLKKKMKVVDISQIFGVKIETIYSIKNGYTWRKL